MASKSYNTSINLEGSIEVTDGANSVIMSPSGSNPVVTLNNGTDFGTLTLDSSGMRLNTTANIHFVASTYTTSNAAAFRTGLGLGTSATVNTGTSGATIPLLNGQNTYSNNQILAMAQPRYYFSETDQGTDLKNWAFRVDGGVFFLTTMLDGLGADTNIYSITRSTRAVAFSGPVTSTATIGYATGAGGTVTQATNKGTGVTLSNACGHITMNAAALAANTAVSFTLTNTLIASTDRLHVNHQAAGTFGAYMVDARCAAGSATIVVRNLTAGSLSEAIVIGFDLCKAVTS